jgi:hypothetical protein
VEEQWAPESGTVGEQSGGDAQEQHDNSMLGDAFNMPVVGPAPVQNNAKTTCDSAPPRSTKSMDAKDEDKDEGEDLD